MLKSKHLLHNAKTKRNQTGIPNHRNNVSNAKLGKSTGICAHQVVCQATHMHTNAHTQTCVRWHKNIHRKSGQANLGQMQLK